MCKTKYEQRSNPTKNDVETIYKNFFQMRVCRLKLQLKSFNLFLGFLCLLLSSLFINILNNPVIVKADTSKDFTQLSQVHTDLNQPLNSRFAFTPTLSADSQVKVESSSGTVTALSNHSYRITTTNNKPAALQVKMKYSHVGISPQGQDVDARAIIQMHNTQAVTIEPIGALSLQGQEPTAQVRLQFVQHNSQQPVALSGYWTIKDFTDQQTLGLSQKNFTQFYCAATTTLKAQAGADFLQLDNNSSQPVSFTALFAQQSELNYQLSGPQKAQIKLAPTALVKLDLPAATMSGVDETVDSLRSVPQAMPVTKQLNPQLWQVPDLLVTDPQKKLPLTTTPLKTKQPVAPDTKRALYTIQQVVPQMAAGFLQQYQIDDYLPAAWQVNPADITITNELNQNMRTHFDIEITAPNHLKIKTQPSFLEQDDFYGHVYTIKLRGKLNPQQVAVSSGQQTLQVSNQARVTTKSKDQTQNYLTNTATNKIKVPITQLQVEQDTYQAGKHYLTGRLVDTEVATKPQQYQFSLNYQDQQNQQQQVQLPVQMQSNAQEGRWQVQLPTDMKPDTNSTTLTVQNPLGISSRQLVRDSSWWEIKQKGPYNTNVLVIHPHELNAAFDTDSNGNWPWYNSNFDTVEIQPGVAAIGSLHKLFTKKLPAVGPSSIDGLANLNTSQVTDMSQMFDRYNGTSIDLSHLDTGKVTNMAGMFSDCSRLTSLNLSRFDTSQVTNMSQMFSYCRSLTSLDLGQFDTSQVTDMSQMFMNCWYLEFVNLSNLDTSKVTNMAGMFFDCYHITSLDLSNFDTSQVTDMSNMFRGDETISRNRLTSIKLNNFDTSKVTNMSSMFRNQPQLATLDVSHFNTGKVTNMGWMFSNCSRLNSIDVSKFDTSQVTDMELMFSNCKMLTSLDVSHFDTANVTNMYKMFENCSNLTNLDVSHFNTSQVKNMAAMFYYCNGLTSLDVSHFDTSQVTDMGQMFNMKGGYYPTYSNLTNLDVSKFDTANVTNMQGMFENCSNLKNLDVSHFNTGKVTLMNQMFYNCASLPIIDVSHFDTSQVTNMSGMFMDCKNITSLDVGNFNTSKVINMSEMFGCPQVSIIDVSHFDTSKVTSMNNMFYNCGKVQVLDVANFNTSKVTDMSGMFRFCGKVQALDVSHFDTSNVTNMGSMFSIDSNLVDLNVSHFDTSKVTDMGSMFNGCSNIKSLDVSHFNTSKVKDMTYMFSSAGMTSLDLSNWDTSSAVYNNNISSMKNIYSNMVNLWKLTVGPKFKLDHLGEFRYDWINSGLSSPIPGHRINDLDEPNQDYYATTNQWQEVDTAHGGTPHQPVGVLRTSRQVDEDLYKPRTDTRTYVWDQTGQMTLKAPTTIALQPHFRLMHPQEDDSVEQKLQVTDNRNLRKDQRWQISIAATPLIKNSDPTQIISGTPIKYHDATHTVNLTINSQLIYLGTSLGNGYQDTWNLPWNLRLKIHPGDVPSPGVYHSQITYNLTNSLT